VEKILTSSKSLTKLSQDLQAVVAGLQKMQNLKQNMLQG
jgi:hypothetical protein